MKISEIFQLLKEGNNEIEKAFEALEKQKKYISIIKKYREARHAFLIGIIRHDEWLRLQQAAINEILLPSEEAKCYYTEGLSWAKDCENQKAINAFTMAISLFTEYAEAYLGRAITRQNQWYKTGNPFDLYAAIWDLQKSLSLGIENKDIIYWNMSVAYTRLENKTIAIKSLKKIKHKSAFPEYKRLEEEIEKIQM